MNKDKGREKNSEVMGRENNPGKTAAASPKDYKILYEQEVVKNRNLYLSLFRDQKTIMMMVDVSTMRIMDANQAAVGFYGYPYETLTKMYAYQLSTYSKKKLSERLRQAASGEQTPFFGQHKLANNTIRDVIVRNGRINFEGKELLFITVYDITERTKIRKSLEDSELKFRKAFRISPDSININRMEDGMYIEINDGFTAITGYTREDVIGKTSLEIDIWAEKEKRDKLVEILKEKGAAHNFPALFRKKNGNTIHGLMSANIINIKGIPHILSVTRNMEEYTKTREALEQSELKFRKIFRTSPDTITISRLEDGRYVEVNENFTIISGYSQKEAKGRTAFDLNIWYDNKERNKLVKVLKEKGFVQNLPVRFRIKNKDIIHCLISANIIDIEGEPYILSIIRNIEEYVKTREALEQSESKFRKAFTISPDAIAITHMETGLYVEINEGFTGMTGYTRDEIVGKTAAEIAIWADIKERGKLLLALKKKGFVKDHPASFRTKNGDIIHALVSANLIDINGKHHIISITRDIEDYLKATEAFRQSEHRYKTLFRLLPAGLMLINDAGTILDANPTYCKNIGYKAEDIIGEKIWKVVNNPLQEKKEHILNYLPTIPENKVAEKEVVNFRKNGDPLYLHLFETRILLENNQPAVLSISMDVTREKHIREELARNTQRLKEAQDIGRLGSWELDWKARKLHWSEGMYRLLELDTSQAPDYGLFQQRIHPDDIEATRHMLKESIKSGKSFKHIHRLLLEDNKIKWVIERGKSFYDKSGKVIRTHGTIQDITRLKETEDKLMELNELLEEKVRDRTARLKKKQQDLSKLLNDMQMIQQKLRNTNYALQNLNHELEAFSYSVSHDLKAPLRAIHGFTTILKEEYYTNLDQEGKTLADDILAEADRMAEIIDALLQLSRTGRKNLNFVEFDLAPLARSVFIEQKKQYNLPQARLEIHNLPPVFADYSLIKQLMVNLFSNALKYSANEPYPLVEIGISEDEKIDETVFYVKDNGVGFDEESAGKMFDAFRRLHSKKEFEGTGIGLAIAKRIVTRHVGEIWAKSQPGNGATLFFTLPKTDKQQES